MAFLFAQLELGLTFVKQSPLDVFAELQSALHPTDSLVLEAKRAFAYEAVIPELRDGKRITLRAGVQTSVASKTAQIDLQDRLIRSRNHYRDTIPGEDDDYH